MAFGISAFSSIVGVLVSANGFFYYKTCSFPSWQIRFKNVCIIYCSCLIVVFRRESIVTISTCLGQFPFPRLGIKFSTYLQCKSCVCKTVHTAYVSVFPARHFSQIKQSKSETIVWLHCMAKSYYTFEN